MSPASNSKSKDKKAGKEPKTSSKSSGHASTGGGIPASGYNPLLGTFHTIEPAPLSSPSALHVIGRFRNIDESEDHSQNSSGAGVEYDSVSNNGSWSGESEEHKEKASHPTRQDAVPGADNDKREKIRQKNERKHQRQKERRAQELHERCSGYLMSRKLEALAQQLVGMGFSQERATMALILNEGRVEASVAWLFEGGDEADKQKDHNLDGGSNLKIDISEELARTADMEIRYKCSKQEVERAIVACEGDLDKAEETLTVQKQDPPVPPKPEEMGDPPTAGNIKLPVPSSPNSLKVQPKPPTAITMHQKRDERDFNYAKAAVTSGSLVDPGSKNIQSLKRIPQKMDWAKPQQVGVMVEKRWPLAGSNPSVSYSLASSLQASAPPAKTEPRFVALGNDLKNLQIGSVREPVIVMQRPQSMNGKQNLSTNVTSSSPSPGTVMGWYPNSVETLKPNGMMPSVSGARSPSPNSASANQLFNQFQYQPQPQFVSNNGAMEAPGGSRANGLWNRAGASQTLAPASNLGLFCGMGANGSSGSSSPVDWSTGGSMMQLDYTNIDWSVDRGGLGRPVQFWPGMSSLVQHENPRTYDSFSPGMSVRPAMRPILSNGSSVPISGMQDGVGSTEASGNGSREWTSPFEEKDLFSLPRQFVSSPSL